MHSFDLTPLFRSTVGFDRMARLLDSVNRLDEQTQSYPPYNIEKLDEDNYRITMAVAGFGEDELDVTVKDGILIVSGKAESKDAERKFLHRGIARRAFERRLQLADYIQVSGARLENGLLHVDLVREVPEAMKPRQIAINTVAGKSKSIEQKAA